MAGEKWQKIREVFDSALQIKPEARPRFVKEICGNDRDLLNEVESLLSSLDNADSFLETPAAQHLDSITGEKTQRLERGKKF